MMAGWLGSLLLPPGCLIWLLPLGYRLRHHTGGRWLLGMIWLSFWLLCTPLVSDALLDSLEPPLAILQADQADVIVILAAGTVSYPTEYGVQENNLKVLTLERLRYGAWLAKKLHKPILISGGGISQSGEAEAVTMARVLAQDYGLTPRWIETRSRNTADNARESAKLLIPLSIRRIYLVSHAWHLYRAIPEFQRQGFIVTPAGLGYHSHSFGLAAIFPSATALLNSYYALHERLGRLWYWLNSN